MRGWGLVKRRWSMVGTGEDSDGAVRKTAAYVRPLNLVPWESWKMPEPRCDMI